ncbi:hypothetical protein [Spirillospora sp. NPDC029432]|uniref:class II glutamine amidotransferase n=1 Tax=Spirillospora sp. NPDC029432 TaxID=3154599 RepID=UPI00345661AE
MFGLLRSPRAGDPGPASDALVVLGTLAEERGRDSAGIALLTGRPAAPGPELPAGSAGERYSDLHHDGCRVVKGRGGFAGVWRPGLVPALDASPTVLGHTRWATQGSPYELANASPLLVAAPHGSPGIVATHNGDIEAGELRALHALPPATGTTDSEPLFQLLAGLRTTAGIAAALASLTGRAALAWADRARPDRVHLARAALSPLSVAVDTDHNLYWASNPRWFREAGRHTGVRFATVVMLREGTYLQAGVVRGRPCVLSRASFLPTARPWDVDDRVWTGFTPADAARDRALLRHRTAERGDEPVPAAAA